MPLVCVCRGAGGCACVSTRASLGSGFWPNPDRGVTDRRDVRISSSALKLMQRAVLAWTLTSSRGVDPIPATWRWFCLERWTLRGALVLWTSEPCRRPEPPIHTLGVCEESNLLSSILEETTRHSEVQYLKIFLQNWMKWERHQDWDRHVFPRAVFCPALRK